MSIEENVQIVKDFFAAMDTGPVPIRECREIDLGRLRIPDRPLSALAELCM